MRNVYFKLPLLLLHWLGQISTEAQRSQNQASEDYFVYHAPIDDTDSWVTLSEAMQICQNQHSSSLASFHSSSQLQAVMDVLEPFRLEETSDGDLFYWVGMNCTKTDPIPIDEGIEKRLIQYSYYDGTPFEYSFFGTNPHLRWFRIPFEACGKCMWITTRGQQKWQIQNGNPCDGSIKASGFICNANSDPEWRAMNPGRDDLTMIQCDENNDCTLDCTGDRYCMYLSNLDISDKKSLQIDCDGQRNCYGMTVNISRVQSVSVRCGRKGDSVSQGHCQRSVIRIRDTPVVGVEMLSTFTFQTGSMIIDGATNVSVEVPKHNKALGEAYLSLANINGTLAVHCTNQESCDSAQIQLMNVSLSKVQCADAFACRDLVINGSGSDSSLSLSCGAIACNDATVNLTGMESVRFNCETNTSCIPMGNVYLDHIREVEIYCKSRDSCTGFDMTLDEVEDLSLFCQVRDSCRNWTGTIGVGDYGVRNLKYDCPREGSCSRSSLWPMAITMELDCRVTGSCGFHQITNANTTLLINQDRSLKVNCLGSRSCVSDEMSSFIRNISKSDGRNLDLSVVCARDSACDGISVDGYCARSVSVEIEKRVTASGMDVVCPNQGRESDKCSVRVGKKGRMKGGSVSMREQDWQQQRHEIEGDPRAFSRVVTSHWDANDGRLDGYCEWDSQDELETSVGCYLDEIGDTGEWAESVVCTDFVMSLYSPVSVMILSLTALFGSLFLFAALNQVLTDRLINKSHWTIHALLISFFLTALFAFAVSMSLQSDESRVRGEIENDDYNGANKVIGEAFPIWASMNLISFVCMLSAFLLWIVHNNDKNPRWMAVFSVAKIDFELSSMDWRKSVISVLVMRSMQMIIVYTILSIHPGSYLASLVIFICIDAVVSVAFDPKKAMIPISSTLLGWFFFSQFSPLSSLWSAVGLYAPRSFFEVIADSNLLLIWFDLFLCEMVFGVLSLVVCIAKTRKQRKQISTLFVQLLDFATDMTVVVFWLANGRVFWALCEVTFVLTAAVVGWLSVRHELSHWKEHLMLSSGLGRGYTKVRLWHAKNEQWKRIDHSVSQLETYYESQPSIILGQSLIMSDLWQQDSSNTADLGPLVISMAITAVSLAGKVDRKVRREVLKKDRLVLTKHHSRFRLSLLIYVFTASDFIVRVTPLCAAVAIAQGKGVPNERPSDGAIATVVCLLSVLFAEQCLGMYYASGMDEAWLRTAKFFALPSIVSCSALFFGCFGMRGVPHLFDYHRFFHVHWLSTFVRVLLFVVLVSAKPDSFNVFLGFYLLWLVSLLLNVLTGLVLQYFGQWKP